MKALIVGALILVLGIVTSSATPDPYFQVLIREIDNPSGNLLDGTSCTPFGFTGVGCNTYLTGGVAVGPNLVNSADNSPLNSHGETRISNLNLILSDSSANTVTEFTGFNISLKLTTVDGLVIDQYNIRVDTTDSQGVYAYTSLRPGTMSTTLSIAWATNIPPPNPATSTPAFTGTTPTPGPTTTTPKLPSDCDEVADTSSGVQTIYPDGSNAVSVYCDQTANGAYTVIQSRGTTTNITFDLPIANYSDSYGEAGIGKNFWLGLDNMNSLSSNGKGYSLLIDLCCGTQLVGRQIYHNFKVSLGFLDSWSLQIKNMKIFRFKFLPNTFLLFPLFNILFLPVDTKTNQYKLTATADLPGIGLDYSSTVKDIGAPFATHANYSLPKSKPECDQFEFYDEENDKGPSTAYGGWWFGSCGNNLNGFMYPSDNGNCSVTQFDKTLLLGVNMRTSTGQTSGGYDVDLMSYDRVRMAVFSFDTLHVDKTDASFCSTP